MKSKQEILAEIAELVKQYDISEKELRAIVASNNEHKSEAVMRLFSYLGGIFVFSGLGVYVSMFWGDFNSVARVAVTLGPGLIAYYMGFFAEGSEKYRNIATPLFLTANFFIPSGLFVTLVELAQGGDWRLGALLVFGTMTGQQFLTFWLFRKTVLLFTSLTFLFASYALAFDYFDIRAVATALILGLSLVLLANSLNSTKFRAIAPFWNFVGSLGFLYGSFDLLQDSYVELVYVLLVVGVIYLSTLQKSRVLLFNGSCALLAYISYFTNKHFVAFLGWPIILVLLGLAFFGIGAGSLRIHRKF